MPSIFISYSRKDEAFARQLALDLDRLGASIWLDVTQIPAGVKWSSAIQQGLNTCDLMILILSPDSVSSMNVEDEWQYFLDKGKPVIPVMYRPADVHFQLRRVQYIDFLDQPYEKALAQLHAELGRKGMKLNPILDGDTLPVQVPKGFVQGSPALAASAARRPFSSGRMTGLVIGAALVLALVSGALISASLNGFARPGASITPDTTRLAIAQQLTETQTPALTDTEAPPTETSQSTATLEPSSPAPTTISVPSPSSCPTKNMISVETLAIIAPFEVDNGSTLEGFDIDLIQAIGKTQGFEVTFPKTPTDVELEKMDSKLSDGSYDLMLGYFADPNPDREKSFSASNPYFVLNTVIVTSNQNIDKFKSLEDLAGAKVGVLISETEPETLAAKVPTAIIRKYESHEQVLNALIKGEVDAIYTDEPFAAHYLVTHPTEARFVFNYPQTNGTNFRVYARKNCQGLIDRVNAGLQKVVASGEYNALYHKYFGIDAPVLPKP